MAPPANPVSPDAPKRLSRARRWITAGGIALLVVAAAAGLLSLIPGMLPSRHDPHRLTSLLEQTIEAHGIDAAVSQYRALRAQGFPALQESASGTKAIAIDPRKKSALSALQELGARTREPHRPLVLFHILAGMIGLGAGAAAMVLRKGSRRHSRAGIVFAVSMLSMSGSATYVALVEPYGEVINIVMGILTFYLVATSWLTARRKPGQTGLIDWAWLLVAVALAAGLVTYGVEAMNSPTGMKDGQAAGVFFVFGAVASVAAALDLRMILRGGVTGAQRLTRHLWRMCAALFIGVTSLFLGQPQLFPVALRNNGVLAVPSLLVLALLGYWLYRVNAAPRTQAVRAQPGVSHPAVR